MSEQEILDIIQRYFSGGYNQGGVSALADGVGPGSPNLPVVNGTLQGIPAGTDQRQYFLQQTPGYQFARGEGIRAIQNSAAAKGTLLTGGTLRGLARFGTGLADQTYGQTVDRYRDLATLGQRTATAPF